MSRKNIAIISPGLLPVPPISGGSVETVIHQASNYTGEKYYLHIYGKTHGALPTSQKHNNIRYFRFNNQPYSSYFAHVRQELSKNPYDIVQVENRPLFIPKSKTLLPKSKFICSLHSLIHTDESLIRKSLTSKIFNLCDIVLVYSRFMQTTLISQFPALSNKFRYIHLGVDPNKFLPKWLPSIQLKSLKLKQSLGITPNQKVIFFAGRIIEKKGLHVLIAAVKEILRIMPDVVLVIGGSSWFGQGASTPYIKNLKNISAPLRKNVIFTNYIPHNVIADYFAMADLFVCPSQWDEPFGLVNVEAMACGTPIVASFRGGIPEIIKSGYNGMLIKKESSPDAFIKPITTILKDKEFTHRLGRNGRHLVDKYFNWQRVGKDFITMYDSLV